MVVEGHADRRGDNIALVGGDAALQTGERVDFVRKGLEVGYLEPCL